MGEPDEQATYEIVPPTWNTQSRQLHRVREQIRGCQGLEQGEGLLAGYKVFFGGGEEVLDLNGGDGHATLWIYLMFLNCIPQNDLNG